MTTTTAGVIYSKELEPDEPSSVDMQNYAIRISRKWHLKIPYESAIALDLDSVPLMSPNSIPYGMAIPNAFGKGVVFCYPTERSGKWIRANECFLTVVYTGHATMISSLTASWDGVVDWRSEPATKSDTLLLSYDLDTGGKRLGIGSNMEGTNIILPQWKRTIIQNMTRQQFADRLSLIYSMIGKVNKSGWTLPPIMAESGSQPAGSWLFLAPQITNFPDRTVQVNYVFDYDPVDVHKYKWYFMKEVRTVVDGMQRTVKSPIGNQVASTIYQEEDFGVLFDPAVDGTTTVAP